MTKVRRKHFFSKVAEVDWNIVWVSNYTTSLSKNLFINHPLLWSVKSFTFLGLRRNLRIKEKKFYSLPTCGHFAYVGISDLYSLRYPDTHLVLWLLSRNLGWKNSSKIFLINNWECYFFYIKILILSCFLLALLLLLLSCFSHVQLCATPGTAAF